MPPRYLSLGNPVSDSPLNRGLVGWWLGMPNNSGGGTFFDLKGLYPGTLTGTGSNRPTWIRGPYGFQGLQFRGYPDTDSVTTSLSNTIVGTPFSIFGWIKFDDVSLVRTAYGFGSSVLINVSATDLRWQQDSGGFPFCKVTTSRSNGVWYSLGVASTGSGAGNTQIYLNGIQADDGADGGTLQTGNFLMGGQSTDGTRYFPGSLSGMRVYSRQLSAGEFWRLHVESQQSNPDILRRWARPAVGNATSPPAVGMVIHRRNRIRTLLRA